MKINKSNKLWSLNLITGIICAIVFILMMANHSFAWAVVEFFLCWGNFACALTSDKTGEQNGTQ